MKYIVIGLGYFGTTLATKLTAMGNEVIGIDNRRERINELKDKITHVMLMDSTNPNAIKSLPLSDMDAVIVAIGDDIGSSILTHSILKKEPVKRIIGRAVSPIHQNILNELGINEVVHPEEDTATSLAAILKIKNAVNVVQLDEEFAIVEITIPEKYVGHTLNTVNLEKRFSLKLIALKSNPQEKETVSPFRRKYQIDLTCDKERILKQSDLMIIAGKIENIVDFID